MMLAGALGRTIDDDGAPVVFATRGGVAMELRMWGRRRERTRDVDLVLRGDPGR